MRKLIMTGFIFVLVCTAAGREPVNLYVSAGSGNDAWSGRFCTPQSNDADGPVATAERGLQLLADLLNESPETSVTLWLSGGVYRPKDTLTLTPRHAGSKPAPVTIASLPGERAVISGLQPITGWNVLPNGWWELQTTNSVSQQSALSRDGLKYPQLYVNDERRLRTRLPENSYFTVREELTPTSSSLEKGPDRFGYHGIDLKASWHALRDIEVLIFQAWTMTRLRVAEIDEATSSVTFTGPARGFRWWQTIRRGHRYVVENVREALGQVGRWYADGQTGTITYVPRPGESLDRASIGAPRLQKLLVLQGDAAKDQWVQYISFENISFEGTGYRTPPEGYKTGQSEAHMPAAIEATGAQFCRFKGCRISHTGGWGMWFRAGSMGNSIDSCDLTDLGAGGIKIGDFRVPHPSPREIEVVNNTVVNCLIAHGGRMHPGGPGVLIADASQNAILRNTITDFYQLGVSVGWSWGYDPSYCHHNIVQGNLITCLGQDVLSDLGGIYTLGLADGTQIIGNRIDNVRSFDYGGWGIYFDEGTSGILCRNNIVTRAEMGGFHQHYGCENRVTNNIFAFNGREQLIRTRPEPHVSLRFEKNIVAYDGGDVLGSRWEGDHPVFDDNVYWNYSGEVRFADRTLGERRLLGLDQHSIVADPLFQDADGGDFHLQPGSPAERIGFQDLGDQKYGCDRPVPQLAQRMFP